MNRVLAIAGVTLRETLRRRLLGALLILTVIAIGLTGWGMASLMAMNVSPAAHRLAASQQTILVMFMFAGMVGLTAVLVAAGSLSSDLESGVILAVFARPVRRVEVLLGKWLGIAGLVVAYTGTLTALEFAVVFHIVGYVPPHPVAAGAAIVAESLALASATLLLTTRLAGMTAGIITAASFFMAWLGGVVGGLGLAYHNVTLIDLGTAARLVLPTDGLWRAAAYNLEPGSIIMLVESSGSRFLGNPFMVVAPPSAAYLAWVAGWFVIVVGLAAWSLQTREF